jgi:hypothetical protein
VQNRANHGNSGQKIKFTLNIDQNDEISLPSNFAEMNGPYTSGNNAAASEFQNSR